MYSYSAVKNLPIFVEIPLFQTDTRIQDIQHILDITDDVSVYSVRMRENTDQKNKHAVLNNKVFD